MSSLLGRYAIALVDRKSGLERRATVSVGLVLTVIGGVVALPPLILYGTAWKTRSDVEGLYARHLALEIETANYRAAFEALIKQTGSAQSTLADGRADSGRSGSARLEPTAATLVVNARAVPPLPPMAASAPAEPSTRAAAGDRLFLEALDTSGHMRALAEAADAPALASGSYRAGVDLQREAEELAAAGRMNDALARAVEADARFRAAKIEAGAHAAARERAPLADASIASTELPLLPVRQPAGSPGGEPRPPLHEPARSAADVEDTIREVINQYVSGLESQSLPALKRVWPSLGGREEQAIRTEFQNARVVQSVFKDPRITINGDTTTVTGFRMHSLLTVDGQRLTSVTKTTMTLRRNGDAWTIERIVHQQ